MDALPDRVVDAVLNEAHRTRQRIVIGPWRIPLMNSALKVAIGAAAVVAVTVAGVNLLPGEPGPGGPPAVSPSPLVSQSVPPPSPSPAVDRMKVGGTEQGLTLELPDGWQNNVYAASPGSVPGEAFFVSVPTNTFPDGCKTTEPGPDIEPTVEAIAAAIAQIPGVPASEPSQTTIAGYDTTYIELTGPSTLACREVNLWRDSPDGNWWISEPNEIVRVHVLDVDGEPVAIAVRSRPSTTDEDRAATAEVLDSIIFDEAP
jgi:hypothetical protein